MRAVDAIDEPVRGHSVLDCEALTQELGVPREAHRDTRGRTRLETVEQPGSRPDRDRGLADHQGAVAQVGRQ